MTQLTVKQLRKALELWTGDEDASIAVSILSVKHGVDHANCTVVPYEVLLHQPEGYAGSHLFNMKRESKS